MESSEVDQPTLMQKWRMHYNSRNFKPEGRAADKWGIVFFLLFAPSLILVQHFMVIPEIARHNRDNRFYLTCFVWYLFVQTVYNYVMIVKKTRRDNIKMEHSKAKFEPGETIPVHSADSIKTEEWKTCPKCQVLAPPRSHHCRICQVCVMKRDHHCFFTGCCIGFHTQRYFAVFVFFCMISSLTVIITNFTFLNKLTPFSGWRIIYYFPPVAFFQVLTAHLWLSQLLTLIQLWFCVVTLLGGIMFFFWEMLIIYRGQTSFEAWKQIHLYRLEPVHNMRSVFGSFWILNFLLPFIPTVQEGNGLYWEKHKRFKGN